VWLGGEANVVGGTDPAAPNTISGCGLAGIEAVGTDCVIQGNFIGTDITGTKAVGDSRGMMISGALNLIVGGTVAGARNLIAGCQNGDAVEIAGASNILEGNYIGTDVNGTSAIPNGEGVVVQGASIIGNLISGNGLPQHNGIGVYVSGPGSVVRNNYIG